MADRLKNIISFAGLVVGVPASLPHLLNVKTVGQVPDVLSLSQGFFTITADATDITVTRLAGDPVAVDILAESWFSMDRVFGAFSEFQPAGLAPRPFINRAGLNSAGAGASPVAGVQRKDWRTTDGPIAALGNGVMSPDNGSLAPPIIGMARAGSIVAMYAFTTGAITAGVLTMTVSNDPGSAGAPAATAAAIVIDNTTPSSPGFVNTVQFAQGTIPYAAADALSVGWAADAALNGGEGADAIVGLILQDD